MDMPDDTPTKVQKQAHSDPEFQQREQEEENFSSFQSNHRHEDSSSSVDKDGFKNMHYYLERDLSFPEVPSNLGKLYQIYIHNVNRKKELKKSIQQLIQKQIKALKIQYDKETFSIQEFIDLDEQSNDYKISKENYEKRKQELQSLASKYRELKIMHVESMMVLDPIMRKTLNTYTEKNKEIISLNVTEDTVAALCKQKHKPRKIRKLKNKKGTKKNIINQQSSRSEEQEDEILNALDKATKSRNTSQTVSDEEDDSRVSFKYIFRNFKFYKTQNGVSFEPFEESYELPPDKNYIGFLVEPISKNYIVYEEKKVYILNAVPNQRELHIKSQINVDFPIIFCGTLKNWLYIGTKDGVMRVYDIKQDCQLNLNKIVFCSYGQEEEITAFALTSNPDAVLFVKKKTYLCEMNLGSYSGYLLSQLPQEIQYIDSRLLMTKNCLYADYYTFGGTHGKAVLQHNQKLKNSVKKRKIVKLHRHNNVEYVIFDEGFGVFGVQSYQQISKK